MSSASSGEGSATSFLVVSSHPVQYVAPLYRQMASDPSVRLKVLYCSRHGLQGELDRQFGTSVRWDIPLLEGYDYEFLSNQSLSPSIYSFWGLLNFSVIRHLQRAPKSVVLVYGWAYAVCWITVIVAKVFGHTVCLRSESPHRLEKRKTLFQQRLRRLLLGRGFFQFVDSFLYIGQQNKKFYELMGVPAYKLVFGPYAVDNVRFQQQAAIHSNDHHALRHRLMLPPQAFVILFSGKYIAKKRPMDLLKAFDQLARPDAALVLMGDGALRSELEEYIAEKALKNVYLTGFINQSAVGEYYAAADAYVMCSTEEETWGLSTNEAMNFGLPLILTDTVGCADDLLLEGTNGFRVPCGQPEQLANTLRKVLSLSVLNRQQMGQHSRERVDQYSYTRIIDSFKRIAIK